jgi:uncharacterized membrane protein
MDLASVLIVIHASFGGAGLLSGVVSMASKKGKRLHKSLGKVFSYSMVLSSLISIPVCFMPGHENMFLFSIAIFTIYLVLTGQRALLFKLKNINNISIWKDWLLSGIMLCFGFCLFLEGCFKFLYPNGPTILFLFFGVLSSLLSLQDMKFYTKKKVSPTQFVQRHIGQMSGAYIASFTAFLSAGLQLKHWLVWILPTVFISIWITYWIRKYQSPKPKPIKS